MIELGLAPRAPGPKARLISGQPCGEECQVSAKGRTGQESELGFNLALRSPAVRCCQVTSPLWFNFIFCKLGAQALLPVPWGRCKAEQKLDVEKD